MKARRSGDCRVCTRSCSAVPPFYSASKRTPITGSPNLPAVSVRSIPAVLHRHNALRHLRDPRSASSVHVHRSAEPGVSALSGIGEFGAVDGVADLVEEAREHRSVAISML